MRFMYLEQNKGQNICVAVRKVIQNQLLHTQNKVDATDVSLEWKVWI